MGYSFEFKGAVKEFSDFKLGPLNFGLETGKAMAYVGHNGAGKTTSLYLLSGHQRPLNGEVEIFGRKNSLDKIEWKFDIGFVSDEPAYFSNWNAEQNLKFLSKFYPKWSDVRLLELCDRLKMPMTKKINKLSRGNVTKLAIISALSLQPKLLILDEPMEGLDPVIREIFADILFEFMESEEHSLIYSTHILKDVERLTDEIVLLSNGQVKMISDKETLLENWRLFEIKGKLHNPEEYGFIKEIKSNDIGSYIKVDNFEAARRLFAELNIEILNESFLDLEDITINILKEDYR